MPRGASQAFLKEWTQRLGHAHAVWKKRGLVAPNALNPSPLRGPIDSNLAMFLDAYRGAPWADGWGGIAANELAVTPTFFSAANTFVAQLLARAPAPEVLPRIPEKAENARIWEAVLTYDIDELKMKRQWNTALYDAFFAFGIVRHGFTPSEEFVSGSDDELLERYAMARPDKPWVRRIRPWDFRCDPLAETIYPDGDATWCAFRSLVCKDDAEKNPKMSVYANIPTVTLKMAEDGSEPEEFIPVWTVYDKRDRTWFQIAEGEDKKLIRQPNDWPLPWEDLPYDACVFNPQMDSIFPVPYAEIIWQSVIDRNKVRTLATELIKRMRRIILIREDALSEESKRKIQNADLTEILTVTGDLSQAIAQVTVGGLDTTLLAYDAILEKDIREAMGQSAMDRGQRVNVDSAAEASSIAQGSAIASGRNVEAVEDFLSSSMRHYAIARQATTFGEELVPILGVEDAALINGRAQAVMVTPDLLAGEFDFKIRAGSTLPETREKRVREAVADLGVMAQAPQMHNLQEGFATYWRARGLNPAKTMLTVEQLQQTQAGTPQGEPQQDNGALANLLSAMQQGQGGLPQ